MLRRLERGDRRPEGTDQTPHLASAGARQEEKFLPLPPFLAGKLCKCGLSDVGVAHEPVSDERALGATQAAQFLRLERQKAQHVIHMRPHGRRTSRAPGPHAGADIMHDGNGRIGRPYFPRIPQRKIGTLDGDHVIGLRDGDRPCGLADTAYELRKTPQHGREPHDGNLIAGKQGLEAMGGKVAAADSHELDRPSAQALQGSDKIGPEQVAGFFACDDGKSKRSSVAHPSHPRSNPTMKRPSSLASLTVSLQSRMKLRSASTAMPASPALWASFTVRGPMAGRSVRSSWPGLEHFTSTPRVLPASRPWPRNAFAR